MSFKPLRALVGLIAALISLYVIYGTFGTALMVFKNVGNSTLPHLKMTATWTVIGQTSLSNFDLWFSSIWVIGVALIVYVFLSAITSTDYDLSGQG